MYFVVVLGFDITISAAPVLFAPVNRGSIAFGIIADIFADSARKHFEPSMCCPFWKKRRGPCSRWPYKRRRPFCASLIFVMPVPKITSAEAFARYVGGKVLRVGRGKAWGGDPSFYYGPAAGRGAWGKPPYGACRRPICGHHRQLHDGRFIHFEW